LKTGSSHNQVNTVDVCCEKGLLSKVTVWGMEIGDSIHGRDTVASFCYHAQIFLPATTSTLGLEPTLPLTHWETEIMILPHFGKRIHE